MSQQLIKKKGKDEETTDPSQGSSETSVPDDLQVCIAQRAYALYEQEGCCDGHDFDHWLQAEREVLRVEPVK